MHSVDWRTTVALSAKGLEMFNFAKTVFLITVCWLARLMSMAKNGTYPGAN